MGTGSRAVQNIRWSVRLYACVLSTALHGCGPGATPESGPANPRPVATPSATTTTPRAPAIRTQARRVKSKNSLPTRAEQAPIVSVRAVVEGKISLGSRVRIIGRCVSAGNGRAAGLWTLFGDSTEIEVRGLVPKKCPSPLAEPLTIFAQVEWTNASRPEPLLLRLPS